MEPIARHGGLLAVTIGNATHSDRGWAGLLNHEVARLKHGLTSDLGRFPSGKSGFPL